MIPGELSAEAEMTPDAAEIETELKKITELTLPFKRKKKEKQGALMNEGALLAICFSLGRLFQKFRVPDCKYLSQEKKASLLYIDCGRWLMLSLNRPFHYAFLSVYWF